MNEKDLWYETTIINLEISYEEVLQALSIYFGFRAKGCTPEQAFEQGVEKYMGTGEIPIKEQ